MKSLMIRFCGTFRTTLSFLLGFLLLVEPGWGVGVSGQEKSLYAQAEQEYFDGNFDRSIDLLGRYLKDANLAFPQRKAGMVLLVHNNLAKNDQKSAHVNIRRLLLLDPEFEAPEDSPAFQSALAQVRAEMATGESKSEESGGIGVVVAVVIGVGAVVGLVVLLASIGD